MTHETLRYSPADSETWRGELGDSMLAGLIHTGQALAKSGNFHPISRLHR